MGLLHEVPEEPLVVDALPVTPLLHLLVVPNVLGLLLHLLDDVLLPGVELVLAAQLEVELVDAPVLQVAAEGQHAHLVHHVQLVGAVKVEDGLEGARVAVEEVLVVHQGVGVAQLHYLVVVAGQGQPAQPGPRIGPQGAPEGLVLLPTHVEENPLVDLRDSPKQKGEFGSVARSNKSFGQ